MPLDWTTLSSRYVFSNQWLRVREDRCRTGAGYLVEGYYVVERHDFAMVVAATATNEVVLVRQYKHGCGQVVCECPAGYIHPGEAPATAAARELREETGYAAARVEPLATLFASPATMSHRMHLFLCRGLVREGAQALDPAEDIEVLLIGLDELMKRVRHNEMVVDAASVSALLLAEPHLRGTL